VIRDTHDLPFIAHFALGRIWKGLSTADRDRFVAAFSEMSIATYAERFDGYSGERFRILSSRDAERGGEEVRTVLVKIDGSTVSLDYLLRRRDGRWRIINVVAEGVSNLALKRAEYAGFVRRHDFDSLMEKMAARLAARTSVAATPPPGR
jgi:phospholipid transport system substrate-binding protein